MPREKATQIFAGRALLVEFAQQSLDGVRHIRRCAAISNRPRNGCELTNAAANAKVVGIDHASILLDLLAFNADVRNPMLSAAIRATGNVQLELFLKSRQALIEFLCKPAGKALRFSERQLAKFRARASHCSTRKGGSAHGQADRGQLASHSGRVLIWHVYDEQVLHDGVAQMPVGVAVGEIGRCAQLLRRYTPAQYVRAHIRKARLLLRMNADVIAMKVRGKLFRLRRIEREAQSVLQFRQERISGPAMLQEKKFQPGALAVLAQHFGLAEQFRHAAYNRDRLLPSDESVQANAKMRIRRETASHTQRETDLVTMRTLSRNGCQ